MQGMRTKPVLTYGALRDDVGSDFISESINFSLDARKLGPESFV